MFLNDPAASPTPKQNIVGMDNFLGSAIRELSFFPPPAEFFEHVSEFF